MTSSYTTSHHITQFDLSSDISVPWTTVLPFSATVRTELLQTVYRNWLL